MTRWVKWNGDFIDNGLLHFEAQASLKYFFRHVLLGAADWR